MSKEINNEGNNKQKPPQKNSLKKLNEKEREVIYNQYYQNLNT
jgi:DNA-directed RNA polymerase specialized sigma subunit